LAMIAEVERSGAQPRHATRQRYCGDGKAAILRRRRRGPSGRKASESQLGALLVSDAPSQSTTPMAMLTRRRSAAQPCDGLGWDVMIELSSRVLSDSLFRSRRTGGAPDDSVGRGPAGEPSVPPRETGRSMRLSLAPRSWRYPG
jgi:hypothetical protein